MKIAGYLHIPKSKRSTQGSQCVGRVSRLKATGVGHCPKRKNQGLNQRYAVPTLQKLQ